MKPLITYLFLISLSALSMGQGAYELGYIRVKGNKPVSTKQVKETMVLDPASWFRRSITKKDLPVFTSEFLERDLERITRLYQRKGFLNVRIHSETILKKGNKVNLALDVEPGEPFRISAVQYHLSGNESLTRSLPPRSYRMIRFKSESLPGAVFSDEAVYNDQRLITREFNDHGHPFTRVSFYLEVDTSQHSVTLNWKFNKGEPARFGATSVSGNQRISNTKILKQLGYEKGDMWSQTIIEQTQDRLYNLGVFRIVSFKAGAVDSLEKYIPLNIQIEEAPRWTTRFGGGYGREDGFRAFAELQYLGFLTQTSRWNLYGKHSGLEPYHFYLKFSQPSFAHPINTLSLHPYAKRESEPAYELDKFGFNISMYQNFSKNVNTFFGLEIEDVRIDSLSGSNSSEEGDEPDFYRKSSVLLGGIFNNAEPVMDPVQGFVISFNVKSNGNFLYKDVPFNKLLGEYKSYHGLTPGLVLAIKLKGGVIFDRKEGIDAPVDERFFAGGSYSVRGWQRSELGPKDELGVPVGGNSLLEGSLEFRINLYRSLILALFMDTGNVWSKSYTFQPNELRYAAGAGIRIKTPIGPAGIDFARPVFEKGSWQFHLNIGHSF